ncbi:MAG: hypothetical protein WCV70_01030 [Patescibacteria group bacterium]|jgi:hypothetical protein
MKKVIAGLAVVLSAAVLLGQAMATENNVPYVNMETGATVVGDEEGGVIVDPDSEEVVVTNGNETIVVDGKNNSVLINNSEGTLIVGGCAANTLCGRILGNIVLRVQKNGEAYYVNPVKKSLHFLGRPDDALGVMKKEGVGIATSDLKKIPIGLSQSSGPDADGDGLSDLMEDAVKTDKNKNDTDNDGFDDKSEIAGGYDPAKGGGARMQVEAGFAKKQKGKIFLQIQDNGEAWYINTKDEKRYFLGRPADAFSIMRFLGVGITEADFVKLSVK